MFDLKSAFIETLVLLTSSFAFGMALDATSSAFIRDQSHAEGIGAPAGDRGVVQAYAANEALPSMSIKDAITQR